MPPRIAGTLAAALGLLMTCGVAPATPARDVPPFFYAYQIKSVTITSTFTKGEASATTRLVLGKRPKQGTLKWYGKKIYLNSNGVARQRLTLAGTVAYTDHDDPACNGTVKLDSTRWKTGIYASLVVTNARDRVVTKPTIYATVGQLPLGSMYERRGGGCENGALTWWEAGASSTLPLSVLGRPSFALSARSSERFEDGSALTWTTTMTVRRIRYQPVDCTRTPYC